LLSLPAGRQGLTLSGALYNALKGGAWRRRMGQNSIDEVLSGFYENIKRLFLHDILEDIGFKSCFNPF
jgi:hypothetical protein